MSARTATLRTATLRAATATAVVAAVAGTVLMPLSAQAAEGNPKALKTTMSAPVPSSPLTRGGATETFELTVTNATDKVSSYHPWMLLDPTGASPLQQSDVVYKVEALSAPATKSEIGQQDGEWQGMFYPVGKTASDGFEIPAGGKLTWKVTIGLGASYPTNNGDFQLRASSFANEIADGGTAALTFKAGPEAKPGTLEAWFDQVGPCDATGADDCQVMAVRYAAGGDGEFNSALATRFSVDMPGLDKADLQARVKVDGQWKDLPGESGNFNLPVIPKGFSAASGHHLTYVQVKLGPQTQVKKLTLVKATASVALAEGNTHSFLSADQQFQLGPVKPASPAPTTPAPTSPAPTSAAPATSAPAPTTAAPTTANTPAATGSLAHTGSDSNTGLYTGLAGVLIALGGAAAWFGARRRRAVRG
ncbi:LPXTG cell wall anchor domain-containing protein [Streptomyces sp. ISL-43]|uniref:LPXTG cell wall anchor domain-containing protein n=1 Tax=Streptomyces sp. ISL-43 TaxID=2819183 RepID=UPI001BE6FC7D|nr:LPXTG cell wall anchor domain-containing protein [Streptomyces sp. ISL-43]MBT2448330.1 LPXTG cell wall anchor domain-containing protein [Streptomyces sp. ISL-43]